MKKLLFSLFKTALMGLGLQAQAQITIGLNDVGAVGDVVYQWSARVTTDGDSGANQTWDFSQMAPTRRDTSSFISPANSPQPSLANISNVVLKQGDSYLYLNRQEIGVNIGHYIRALVADLPQTVGGVSSLIFRLNTPITYLRNNTTFGQSFNETSNSRFTFPFDTTINFGGQTVTLDSVRVTANIKQNRRVNGWGTLQLPQWENGTNVGTTSTEALRMTNKLNVEFLLQGNAFTELFGIRVPLGWQTLPFNLPTINEVTTLYWGVGKKMPLLEISYDTNGVASDASFQNAQSPQSTARTLGNIGVQTYPNPASDFLMVGLPAENVRYTIADLKGTMLNQGILGLGENKLSLKSIPNGAYQIWFQNGAGINTRIRFVIAK